MRRETLPFTTEADWLKWRTLDITSTDVSALFGLSPYCTLFEIWHRKQSGLAPEFNENERMKWGKRFEGPTAEGIAQDQGWTVKPFKDYMRAPEARIGSSFDYIRLGERNELLEIKHVDWLQFKQGWIIDADGIEAPTHIELQVQHQMLVSGLDKAWIAVMVGGNDVRLIERNADKQVHDAILKRCAAFWKSVDDLIEPTPDFTRDGDTISRLNGYSQPGSVLDASEKTDLIDLMARHNRLGAEIRDLTAIRDALKAEILTKIGDAAKVFAGPYTLTCGMIGPAEISYTRDGYRNFRITKKKQPTEEEGKP